MIAMVFNLIFFAAGLGILIKAANLLVDGASSIASRFNINPMVIGLTIVAFGTSAPELVVSVTSALSGNTEIAFGNIVGSNIANILLILGISALIAPLTVNKNTVWKEVPMSFLGAIVLAILGFQNVIDSSNFHTFFGSENNAIGSLTFSNGLILLAFFIIFIYYTFGIAKVTADENPVINKFSLPKSIIFIIAGLMGLMLGSKFLVDNAVILAKILGVSDQFIGLTLVAVGTSVPELVTSIVAAARKKVELAVGNVIGSNIFNIFFILGITSLVSDIPINSQGLLDILVLLLTTTVLFVSFFILKKRSIGKIEGGTMLIAYTCYIAFLIIRG
jgi:cation:H+ antiporter